MSTVIKYILEIDVKKSKKALKELSQVTDDLDDELSKLKGVTGEAQTGFKTTGGAAKALKSQLLPLTAGVAAVSFAALKMGQAFVEGGKKVFNFVNDAVDAVNRLNDLSTASNLAAETIQAVEMAFRASGQAASTGDTIIKKFPQRMAEIRKKGSEANKVLKTLGVEIIDTSGKFRSSDLVFKDIIKSLQNLEDQELKTAAAQKIFKRDVGNLLVALGNSGPLDRFIAFTKKFGVDAKKSADDAATFQQRLAGVSIALAFLRDRIVDAFGGMQFFNRVLKETVGAIVFTAEIITSFRQEFGFLGHVIVNLIKEQMMPLIKIMQLMGKIAPSIGKTIGQIANKINTRSKGVGLFANMDKRIAAAKKSADEAKKSISNFGKEIETAGEKSKTAETMLAKLQKLFDELENEKGDGPKTAGEKAKNAAKEYEKLQKAQAGAIARFQELKAVQKDGDITAASALKNTNKLMRVFDKLQLPTEKLREFQDLLRQELKLEAFAKIDAAFLNLKIPDQDIKNFITNLEKVEETAKNMGNVKIQFKIFAQVVAGIIGDIIKSAGNPDVMVNSIAKAFGPLPGLIASSITGLFDGLASLGEKTPEELVEEGKQRNEAIAKGIGMIPSLLLEVLPPLLIDLAARLIKAIFELPIRIWDSGKRVISNLIENFKEDPFGVKSGPMNILERAGVLDRFDKKLGGGRFIPQALNGLSFTGERRGLAMLHEGEIVTPRSGRMSQALTKNFGNNGAGVNVTINSAVVDGNVIDTLVRQIEERFLLFGQSKSALFGGS